MNGQLSIFELMKPELIPLDELSEEEMVMTVGNHIGISFEYNEKFREYTAKVKDAKLSLCYSNYSLDDNHNRFISCGYSRKWEGCGSPCDSIEEAIAFFKQRV